jgi:hypothetical protein
MRKEEYCKAERKSQEDVMDLGLIHDDKDPRYFEEWGVKRGAAHHWVYDILPSAKRRRYNANGVMRCGSAHPLCRYNVMYNIAYGRCSTQRIKPSDHQSPSSSS